MHRMLIERIENRVLVGIIAFVGTMVLVGWVAINENARMASFTRQYEARAIERGAALFAGNCSTCHGTEGRGITGRAPGLNSPAFFGHDFLTTWNDELDTLNKQISTLEEEKVALQAELAAEGGVTDRRRTEIETRLPEIDADLANQERLDRIAAVTAEREAQVASMTAAVDLGYNPDQPNRLVQVGWGGTLNSFIITTLIHGRPTSISYWPNPMVSWSNRSGGPLRDDQIQDIATYIQNWDKGNDWTLEDLLAVQQYPIIPGEGGGAPTAEAVGGDVDAAFAAVSALVGDPVRGQALYENKERSQRAERLGCSGCHYGALQGPSYDGLWERVVTERMADPLLAGYTPEYYVVESIVATGAYTVEGWNSGVMPANFGQRMSAQDVADVLEFIKASDPNYVAPAQPESAEGETTPEATPTP